MSYELFCDGKPVIVNCGTYAYQCKERNFFRSTAAHNTVMIDGAEQSQCWGSFRLAKRSQTKVLEVADNSITMEMTDWKNRKAQRKIVLDDTLTVADTAVGHSLTSFIHVLGDLEVSYSSEEQIVKQEYAPDYGEKETVAVRKLTAKHTVEYKINCDK